MTTSTDTTVPVVDPPVAASAPAPADARTWLRRTAGPAALGLFLVFAYLAVQDLTISRQMFWANVAIQVLYVSSVAYLYRVVGTSSFGQAIMFGGGAYAVALADERITNSAALLVVGIVVGLVLGALVGLFIFRVSGLRFSIVTLALGQALHQFANKQKSLGGETGLYGVTRNSFLGFDIKGLGDYLLVIGLIVVAGIFLIRWLERSKLGVVMQAMRSSEGRASALGYSVPRYRYLGFVIAGGFAGLCGAMHAQLWGLVSTDLVHWKMSGDAILMTLVGGMHSILGPIVGSFTYLVLVDEVSDITTSWLLWVGGILLVVVLAAPTGLVGLAQKAIEKLRGLRTNKEVGE